MPDDTIDPTSAPTPRPKPPARSVAEPEPKSETSKRLDAEVTVKLWPGEKNFNGQQSIQMRPPVGRPHMFVRARREPLETTMTRRQALRLRHEGYEVEGLD